MGHRINYILVTIFLISLSMRFFAAMPMTAPRHADPAYYYTVAENLYHGRGFQIDYIWHFLKKWPSLTHPSNDWWMPLNSILIFLSFKLLGLSLLSSLIPNILLGATLPILTYFIAKELNNDDNTALLASLLVFVNPDLFISSLYTETIIPYAIFVGVSFIMVYKTIIQQSHKVYRWILLGFLLAVCHLTRLDAFILILSINIFFFYYRTKRDKLPIRYLIFIDSSYILGMSPWFIRNYHAFGTILPSFLKDGMFLKTYEALYSYDFSFARKEFFQLPIAMIIYMKIKQIAAGLYLVCYRAILPLFVFVYLGLTVRTSDRWKTLPVLIYFFFFFVYTLFTSFNLNTNTLPSFLPFIISIASNGLWQTGVLFERHLKLSGKKLLYGIIIILVIYNLILVGFDLKNVYQIDHQTSGDLIALNRYLKEKYKPEEIVIMTKDPWDVYYFTKVKCVQIPYENLEKLIYVAKKYKVTHLLLPAPRSFLWPIYDGSRINQDIVFEYQVPGSYLKLFKIGHAQ